MGPALVLAMLAPAEAPVVVHRAHGLFSEIYVVDEGPMRYLRFDWEHGDDQTVIERGRPDRLAMRYLEGALIGVAAPPDPRRLLMIGLGGGAFTTFLAHEMPALEIDVVEIDPAVVEVAKRYFGVKESPRLEIHVDDGARFVALAEHRYDVVFVDAYSGDDLPAHLTGKRFFRSVERRLAPSGVVVLNVAVDSMDVERTLLATVSSVFRHCVRLTIEEEENTIVIASADPLPRDLPERAAGFARASKLDLPLAALAAKHRGCVPARRSR